MKFPQWRSLGLALFVVTSFFLANPNPVSAQQVVFSDTFDGPVNQWQPTRDTGIGWYLTNGRMEGFVNWFFTSTELVPKDQFWNPAWKNIEYELDFTPLQGEDRTISFNFKDTNNWYQIHFSSSALNLVHVKNGLTPLNLFYPYFLPNGFTYHIKIKLNQNTITIYVNGLVVAQTQDLDLPQSTGKIGLKAATGTAWPTRVQFDNVIVRSFDNLPPPPTEVQLAVSLLKQTNPAWANLEYDKAKVWSPDQVDISRWGCTLTSMAMILQYYGINQLPNELPLTPATLNTWLNGEKDGYLNGGYVNFVAITRLALQLHSVLNTPKLEYSKVTTSLMEKAIAEIRAQRPVMLEIAGHFLVGSGVSADDATLFIKDPAWKFTTFAQHKTNLISVRKFLPSQTDLSALLITYPAHVHVTVKDSNGQIIPNIETPLDGITSFSEDGSPIKTQTPMLQSFITKPNNGQYRIEVIQQRPDVTPVSIYAYDQSAQPTIFKQQHVGDQTVRSYELTYNKQAASSLKPVMSWPAFRRELQILKATGKLRTEFFFSSLDQLAQYAIESSPSRQLRYQQLLKALIPTGRLFLDPSVMESLTQDLMAIPI